MWPTSPDELIEAQRALATAAPDPWQPGDDPVAIGASAIVFPRGDHCPALPSPAAGGTGAIGDRAWASAVVLRRRHVLAEVVVTGTASGPYLPGLLALREGPCLEAALRALAIAPDVLLVDATGRDHPRRAGLALHLGEVTGLPTVGVTHRPLLARGDWPGPERGACAPLTLDGETVGAWVRTRAGARPVAVHPAWRTSLEVAVDVVLMAARGHRTPEPLRHARRLARVARAAAG